MAGVRVGHGDEGRDARLSPFERKEELLALAKRRSPGAWLNAGRANPSWLALEPRAAFFRLGEFALAEAGRTSVGPGLGGLPHKGGLWERLQRFLDECPESPGDRLLRVGVPRACERHGFAADSLIAEWTDGVLGDHYPVPVRMLVHAEALVREHLTAELFGGDAEAGRFDLFAVEGATAGIGYVFQALLQSRLLARGDRIAVGVPIFTPYLDVPRLPEYGFELVKIAQHPDAGWRYPTAELDKLRDPRVRAFLIVNPSNPTAAALDSAALECVGAILRARPDLVVITDDVYAPFVAHYRSLASVAPRQSIVIYSFSKLWGTTGLRLGVVGVHRASVLDERLAAGATDARAAARARYGSISTAPDRLKLIDRMVAESRSVALHHTAGLSTPQQVLMALIALDALLDEAGERKARVRAILKSRSQRLFAAMGLAPPDDPLLTHFYATVDVAALARARHGEDFARWLAARSAAGDFTRRLAEERGIVVLDGGGFDAPDTSVRISLANLPDASYESVGRGIRELLAEYHDRWCSERAGAEHGRTRPPA